MGRVGYRGGYRGGGTIIGPGDRDWFGDPGATDVVHRPPGQRPHKAQPQPRMTAAHQAQIDKLPDPYAIRQVFR